ncbi:GNAT family N-acetyltransferase [Aquamicrobium sp. LC103]|uniref:GNAT family N-acetyltransferase n=1 Tax=Aquamicrobium sp. LC103 TaxID=1120658 RepID=UPI00063E8DEE|nr:GNAT family N-acetyltransferase [Aquamicrobium sp. LC103]TKT82572.1 GNAT family N-acetyltransferase [Aquamicrobium sp. LC103]
MSDVPVLSTQRLVLREHRPEDLPSYAALWADPDVVRFIGGKPLDTEAAWGRILRYRGMWATLGFGFWAIEHEGRLIGEAGVQDVRRAIEPSLAGTLECGWAITPDLHGRGFAREAVAALLGWADANHPTRAQSAIIAPANAASIRVATNFGFRETARGTYHDAELIQFRRRPGG